MMRETQTSKYIVNEIKKCTHDIVYFVENYIKIKNNITGEENLIMLYKKQREVLESMSKSQKFCLEAARQSGKTLLSQLYILWKCNFFKNSKCLMVSINSHNFKNIANNIEYFQSTIPGWLKSVAVFDSLRWTNENFITFDNGSSISLSIRSTFNPRGQNLSVLIFDEYSFYSELNPLYLTHGIRSDNSETLDFFKNSIISTMEGQLIITGTDSPHDNIFKLIKFGGENFTSWTKESMNWDDIPNRGLKWKNEMIDYIGQKMFEQEFCVEK